MQPLAVKGQKKRNVAIWQGRDVAGQNAAFTTFVKTRHFGRQIEKGQKKKEERVEIREK